MYYTANAKSGDSAFRLTGTATTGNSSYLYKIADTRIRINSNMALTFWQRTENALGANIIVDLLLDDGNYLSDAAGYSLQGSATIDTWKQRTVNIPSSLAAQNRYITAVIIAYRDTGTTGNFTALIDDIIISNN
jgi:hypothetical protein